MSTTQEGWVVVPVEPTEAMYLAICGPGMWPERYRAMLKAVPTPPAASVPVCGTCGDLRFVPGFAMDELPCPDCTPPPVPCDEREGVAFSGRLSCCRKKGMSLCDDCPNRRAPLPAPQAGAEPQQDGYNPHCPNCVAPWKCNGPHTPLATSFPNLVEHHPPTPAPSVVRVAEEFNWKAIENFARLVDESLIRDDIAGELRALVRKLRAGEDGS